MFKPKGIKFSYRDGEVEICINRKVVLTEEAINRITTAILNEVNSTMCPSEKHPDYFPMPLNLGQEMSVTSDIVAHVYTPAQSRMQAVKEKPDFDVITPDPIKLISAGTKSGRFEPSPVPYEKEEEIKASVASPQPTESGAVAQAMARALRAQSPDKVEKSHPIPPAAPVALKDIPPNKLVFRACTCGWLAITQAGKLENTCRCGKDHSHEAPIYYPLESACSSCGNPTWGFGNAGFTEYKCKSCDAPVDVVLNIKKGKLYGGSKM